MILLQTKKRWMRKHLKKIKTIFNQVYIVASWINSLKIIIEIDKIKASQVHNNNTLILRWKIYSNENERNEDITITIMNFNWNKKKHLKSVNTTFTHHDKLKNLIIIVEELINYCEKTINGRKKIYKVYFNNQTLLKMIYVILLMFN